MKKLKPIFIPAPAQTMMTPAETTAYLEAKRPELDDVLNAMDRASEQFSNAARHAKRFPMSTASHKHLILGFAAVEQSIADYRHLMTKKEEVTR